MSDAYKPLPLAHPNAMGMTAGNYPDEMTLPMREELTRAGIVEFLTAGDVAKALDDHQGTAVVMVNSVCGCAAGNARPGLRAALALSAHRPDSAYTAFAGVHKEAVDAVRQRIQAPPSSPSIVLFRNGAPVAIMHRSDIESRDAEGVAKVLTAMFEEFCSEG